MRIKSHSASQIVELEDGSQGQIFPDDLDVTLNWKPETDLTLVFIAQNAREVTLSAGNLTLIDPLLPYDCRFLDGSKTLVVKVPRLELRARLGRNRELVARLVRPVRVDDSL